MCIYRNTAPATGLFKLIIVSICQQHCDWCISSNTYLIGLEARASTAQIPITSAAAYIGSWCNYTYVRPIHINTPPRFLIYYIIIRHIMNHIAIKIKQGKIKKTLELYQVDGLTLSITPMPVRDEDFIADDKVQSSPAKGAIISRIIKNIAIFFSQYLLCTKNKNTRT